MLIGLNDSNITKEIATIYSFLEDIFKHPYDKKRLKLKNYYTTEARCAITVLINMMSYTIGYTCEKTKKYDTEIINNIMSKSPIWNKIKCKEELSPNDKFAQLRNCFEHANFMTLIDDENGNYGHEEYYNRIKIYFNNDKIEGLVEFVEFVGLYSKCIELITKYDSKTTLVNDIITNNRPTIIRNSRDLEKVMNSFVVYDMSSSFNSSLTDVIITVDNSNFSDFAHYGTAIKRYVWDEKILFDDSMLDNKETRENIINKINAGNNQINITTRKMTELEKEKMRNYTKYFTNNYSHSFKVTNDFITQFFSNYKVCFKAKDVLVHIFSVLPDNSSCSLYDVQKEYASNNKLISNYDDLVAISPGLYLISILSSAHYFLNYSYEFNKKIDDGVFRYSGINLDDIVIENKTNDRLVKTTDPMLKENEELFLIRKQLNELFNQLIWSKKQIEILNNAQNKDPNKSSKLINIKNFMDTYDERKKDLEDRELLLSSKIDNSVDNLPYVDSYHLFRHLRNSIAHGRFMVDFDKGYASGNLGDSDIIFYDIADGVDDIFENANVVIRMKLNRFEKMSKDLSNIICSQVSENIYFEITKSIINRH